MRSTAVLLVTALLALSSVAAVGTSHPTGTTTRALTTVPTASDAANVTRNSGTTIRISLRENGDARWNVTARFNLQDANETATFRDVARRYTNGTTDAGFTRNTFEQFAQRAADSTGRPMAIQNVSRSGYVRHNGSVGLLSISFTWTNFARIENNRVVLGDAFSTDSGLWLSSLSGDQTLVIEGPDDYYIVGASPAGGTITGGDTLRYEGPQEFNTDGLSVTYAPRTTATTVRNTTTPGEFPDVSGIFGLVFALIVFGLGGIGAYALAQRRKVDPDPPATAGTGTSVESPPPAADDGADPSEDESGEDEPDVELLSDEERVLRLLRKNDGRMKQANIVKETNWSNAKVSQLLSKMDDNGDVDKLRIGRENLITLPDEDVTDTD